PRRAPRSASAGIRSSARRRPDGALEGGALRLTAGDEKDVVSFRRLAGSFPLFAEWRKQAFSVFHFCHCLHPSSPQERTRMIVFPGRRSVGLKAATAPSRVETVPMFVRSRPSRTRWTT